MTLTSRQKLLRCALFILLCCSTYFQSSLKIPAYFSLATGLDYNHSFATTKLKLFNLTSSLKTWIILAFFFFYIILMPFLLF